MANISTYLANALLNESFGQAPYTAPTMYLGLFTTAPSMPSGTGGVEVSGSGYARQSMAGAIAAASSGSITTSQSVTFPVASGSWGSIVALGIWDSLSGGNLLWEGALSQPQTIGTGSELSFPAGNITASLT